MKQFKTIITLSAIAAALLMTTTLAAQPKAIGLRLGFTGAELSYEHFAGSPSFLEAELGVDWLMPRPHFKGTAMYNYVFLQPGWTLRGDWSMYAGGGLSIGAGDYFMMSVPIQLGLEFRFWFPLQLAVDLRPHFGFITRGEGGIRFYNEGMMGFLPSISARYFF